ncbi:MAG: sugar ABC transporter permease [Eubacteriales bacterium]|nr:sugar ABC transporter permease [Eubacteriales bacterium]
MKKKITFWCFVLPLLIPFVIVVLIPAAMGFYYALTDWNGVGSSARFIGFENFAYIFTQDKDFWLAFGRTAAFSAIAIVVINILAYLLALLVTQHIRGVNFMRSAFFMPNLIGGLLLGFIWKFIFSQVIDSLGKASGIGFFRNMLAKPGSAMFALMVVVTWQLAGYMMLIYISQIQNIPKSVIEAAMIDGANPFQRLRYIITPLMGPAFTICLFFTISNTFKLYDQNLSLTNGGPMRMTELVSLDIYNTAFDYGMMGRAQAKAILFLIAVVLISVIQLNVTKKREVEM